MSTINIIYNVIKWRAAALKSTKENNWGIEKFPGVWLLHEIGWKYQITTYFCLSINEFII